MSTELFSLLWPRFVPLSDWTLPLRGHPRLYILIMQFKTSPATSTFHQLSKDYLACLRISWFSAFSAQETRNGGKHGSNFKQIQNHHFGKKLLFCFAFEMTTVFTSNDSVNYFSSSDENLGIKTSALGDRGTGVSPLRFLGICMHVLAWVRARVFRASVGEY